MAELEAALRGINLAIAWQMKSILLQTDSAAVHKWISDAISGRARLRTKAHGDMLIRRRVDLIRQLVSEFQLTLSVQLVPSSENRADRLTRIPKEWVREGAADEHLESCEESEESARLCCAADATTGQDGAVSAPTLAAIKCVHEQAGHPGVRRTLYFARRELSKRVTRPQVQAVQWCDSAMSAIQSIPPP